MISDTIKYEDSEAEENPLLSSSKIEKITALWALSESSLGGILHAFKFPFRGMIISSAAIILIGMIAKFSDKRGQIIKSTLFVNMIKAVVSPHTPLTAYLAVFLQGILGEIYFATKKIRLISSLLLGITVSLLNGFQKVLVLTMIYGTTLWKTIDDLINYIAKDWLMINIENPLNFSGLLIGFYVANHIIIGICAGILAYIIPNSVDEKLKEPAFLIPLIDQIQSEKKILKKKKMAKTIVNNYSV